MAAYMIYEAWIEQFDPSYGGGPEYGGFPPEVFAGWEEEAWELAAEYVANISSPHSGFDRCFKESTWQIVGKKQYTPHGEEQLFPEGWEEDIIQVTEWNDFIPGNYITVTEENKDFTAIRIRNKLITETFGWTTSTGDWWEANSENTYFTWSGVAFEDMQYEEVSFVLRNVQPRIGREMKMAWVVEGHYNTEWDEISSTLIESDGLLVWDVSGTHWSEDEVFDYVGNVQASIMCYAKRTQDFWFWSVGDGPHFDDIDSSPFSVPLPSWYGHSYNYVDNVSDEIVGAGYVICYHPPFWTDGLNYDWDIDVWSQQPSINRQQRVNFKKGIENIALMQRASNDSESINSRDIITKGYYSEEENIINDVDVVKSVLKVLKLNEGGLINGDKKYR